MIEPLHPAAPKACLKDSKLYEYLALCDALRVGKAREKNLAMVEFKKRLCYRLELRRGVRQLTD
jgi:hypothetical protein